MKRLIDPTTDDTNGLRADETWTVFYFRQPRTGSEQIEVAAVLRTQKTRSFFWNVVTKKHLTRFEARNCKLQLRSLKCIYHINHTIIQNVGSGLNPQVKTSFLLRYQKQPPVNTGSTWKFPVSFRAHRKSFITSSFQNKSAAVTLIWRVECKYEFRLRQQQMLNTWLRG